MRFFDSCAQRVTLADVAEDIANDLAFEKHLKRERAKSLAAKKGKETNANETTCNC